MFTTSPKITYKDSGHVVKVLAGPDKGQIGITVGSVRWGAIRLFQVRLLGGGIIERPREDFKEMAR